MLNIKNLQVGERARILGFSQCDAHYRQRLLSMGLLPGAIIELSCIAPLGDPLQIVAGGTVLSLRKAEASVLKLEKITL